MKGPQGDGGADASSLDARFLHPVREVGTTFGAFAPRATCPHRLDEEGEDGGSATGPGEPGRFAEARVPVCQPRTGDCEVP